MNQRQEVRLRRLSEWLRVSNRRFLFELLVPPTDQQLSKLGGSRERYDRELRPALMMQAITALQGAGVEPDLWKIEGVDDRQACGEIARVTRRDGRDRIGCLVLGRGASIEQVDAWLRAGAGVEGYTGFAVGRSIFGDAVQAFARDPLGYDVQRGVREISARYRRFIEVYEAAEEEAAAP